MMLYPTLDSLTDKVGSRFYLVNFIANRARKIAQDAINHEEILNEKPVRLALEELANGQITAERRD